MSTWVYDDGGRKAAGFIGKLTVGDCVPRAIAIATQIPYREVYDELNIRTKNWLAISRSRHAIRSRSSKSSSVRNGTWDDVTKPYLADLGWVWQHTMSIGSGTTVHLKAEELPSGRLIVKCSRHLVAVINGVVYDTHDSTRGGTRAVYGYWRPA